MCVSVGRRVLPEPADQILFALKTEQGLAKLFELLCGQMLNLFGSWLISVCSTLTLPLAPKSRRAIRALQPVPEYG